MGIIVLSTVAYFISSYFLKREFEAMGIPKGMTRGTVVFALALAIAYGVAYLAGLLVP